MTHDQYVNGYNKAVRSINHWLFSQIYNESQLLCLETPQINSTHLMNSSFACYLRQKKGVFGDLCFLQKHWPGSLNKYLPFLHQHSHFLDLGAWIIVVDSVNICCCCCNCFSHRIYIYIFFTRNACGPFLIEAFLQDMDVTLSSLSAYAEPVSSKGRGSGWL